MNSHNGQEPTVDLRVTTTLSQVVDVLDAQGAQYALIGGLELDWVRREADEAGLDQQRLDDFEQLVTDFYRM